MHSSYSIQFTQFKKGFLPREQWPKATNQREMWDFILGSLAPNLRETLLERTTPSTGGSELSKGHLDRALVFNGVIPGHQVITYVSTIELDEVFKFVVHFEVWRGAFGQKFTDATSANLCLQEHFPKPEGEDEAA